MIYKLILEEHCPEMEYIQYKKNIVEDEFSQWPNDGNQGTTHEYNYSTETMSEIYEIDETPEVMFPIGSNIIYQ